MTDLYLIYYYILKNVTLDTDQFIMCVRVTEKGKEKMMKGNHHSIESNISDMKHSPYFHFPKLPKYHVHAAYST